MNLQTSAARVASLVFATSLAGLALSYDLSKTVAARLDWDSTCVRMATEAGPLNLVSASVLLRF